ncbi:MAG TPA: DUF5916 domain-containing protein [Gemmatimonadaceae bacterium]|nr:DUF5916 domain-containing protein [Gemmatimonadaceae bacterium]
MIFVRPIFFALLLFPFAALSQEAVSRPKLRIDSASSNAISLDGKLDESVWSHADSISDLRQVEPTEGSLPSQRTIIKVVSTGDALVVGVRALDTEPTRIVSYTRERDASLTSEDYIKVVLDTYLDGRSGYVFSVNPNGARYDALVAEQGEDENESWDAVWEAATERDATGWSAEIRIPFSSILYGARLSEWGFNVERRIQRLQETDRWASAEQDYQITQTSRAGLLTHLPPPNIGIGLSLRPSIAGGIERESRDASAVARGKVSLDATQRIGSNTLASLTVNTDFGETEVDERRVNLTRFPLFFPEKRTFFLEGADIFAFGLGLDEDVIPFFSRRIGLLEGRQVPIDAGIKLTGRLGGTNFGALTVRTRDVTDLSTEATMSVLRMQQNVLEESSIGFIATAGDPLERSGSWMFGPDFTYHTSHFRGDKNLLVGAWGLATGRDELGSDRTTAGLKIDYPNDLWDVNFRYKRIGRDFDPSLGFVPRNAVHIVSSSINWQPRPKNPIGPLHIRQCFWENEPSLVTDLSGEWESYRVFMAPVNCRLESGDRFELNIVPTGERLREPFEIADGVVLPEGSYHFNRYRAEFGFAAKRKLSGQATWWFGPFYDGHLNQFELTGAWKPSPLFIVEVNGERDVARLREGHFTQDVVGTRLKVNVSPDFQVASLLQYDDESNSFGSNTRIRWTFDPLGDFFVVYNHNMRTRDPLTRDRRFSFDSNQLLVKLQYAFRF